MSSSEKTVNLSNRLTPATAVKKRAGGLLAEKLRQKGWSITSAALYLGVSRQRLYSVFADPGRARLWSCAVEGIPHFSPQIAELLKSFSLFDPPAEASRARVPAITFCRSTTHPPHRQPSDEKPSWMPVQSTPDYIDRRVEYPTAQFARPA